MVEHNREIFLGHAFIKKPVARKTNFFRLKDSLKAAQKPAKINLTYIDPKKRLQFTEFLYSPLNNKKIPRIFWFGCKQSLVLPKKLGDLFTKLFWPAMRKKITGAIYLNSEKSLQFFESECFFNLFLEVFRSKEELPCSDLIQ